jgi:hypothetical protein
MPPATENDRARVEFFRLGTQYYVTGRFATMEVLVPVAGNLLHHAVEMYIKGALVRHKGLGSLQNLRHDLTKLWKTLKETLPDDASESLDGALQELHKFEVLRYPDRAIHEGTSLMLSRYRSHKSEISGSGILPPQYSLGKLCTGSAAS